MWQVMCLKVRWAFFLFFLTQMLKRRTSALLPITTLYPLFNQGYTTKIIDNRTNDLRNNPKV